jgi:dTDP-4-amino-4,6-dideoxygalactose transaminase
LQRHLKAAGIGAQIHYPTPVHAQEAYRGGGVRVCGSLSTTERLAREILSVPAYPGLGEDRVREVAEAIRGFGG